MASSSFIPRPVVGGAASSSLGKTVLPSASVASFQNQQIGALTAGLGAGAAQQLSPTQVALGQKAAQSAVQVGTQKQQGQVKVGAERLTRLAQQAAQQRKAAANPVGTSQGVGQPYKPDGSLSQSRNGVFQAASQYVNKTPYVWGGKTAKGTDCAGLVMMVYGQLGYDLGDYNKTRKLSTIPGVRTSLNNLRAGDIVAWKDGSHVAIYAGNGEIIEAAKPGTNVRRHKLWSNDVYGIALRLPGE